MGDNEIYNEGSEYIVPQAQNGLPASQNVEVIRELINNKKFKKNEQTGEIIDGDHPKELDESFWSVYTHDFLYANLTQTDIDVIRYLAKSNECIALAAKPEEKLGLQDIIDETNQEILTIVKTTRSRDGFERKMINTSTQQHLVGNVGQSNQNRGFLGRIGGALFGGGLGGVGQGGGRF